MKTIRYPSSAWLFVFLFLGFTYANAQVTETTDTHKPETELHPEIFWDIKAYRPEAELLKVKAITADGKMYDVKAIQYEEDTSLLDVKVMMNGERLPVKLIIKTKEKFFPLKGIDKDGNLLDIKAITPDGEILDIKGISRTGNSINIRAIADYGLYYNLLAMAPDGMVNTIKGLKMTSQTLETTINGVKVFAHVKAMCDIEDKL